MRPRLLTAIKIGVFVAALLPLLQLLWLGLETYRGTGDGLGINPIEKLTHSTGRWTLYLLLVTLALTPLRKLTGQNVFVRLRRMLGLWAFFYGCLHLGTYLFDQFFDFRAIGKDVLKRPYITVGTLAFLLMVPLAVTSTTAMIRRLGRRWQTLHRLIYGIAVLGVIHFAWLVKGRALVRQPGLLGAILTILLLFRLVFWIRRR